MKTLTKGRQPKPDFSVSFFQRKTQLIQQVEDSYRKGIFNPGMYMHWHQTICAIMNGKDLQLVANKLP
jgi:hypothetical protein